jgi:hypothetical protein
MNKLWLLLATVGFIALVLGGRWIAAARQADARQMQFKVDSEKAREQRKAAHTAVGKREYVLEVISLGVTLDKYRQGKLWDALQDGNPFQLLREQDPKKYPWTDLDKLGMSGGRGGAALENGVAYTVSEWGVPVFNAAAPNHNVLDHDTPLTPDMGLADGADSSGLSNYLFVVGPRRFEERPDRILDDVFAFFDANPDIPYVILNSNDGMYIRNAYRPAGAPWLVKDGYYVPEMPDSAVLLLLARRERVEPLRPFAYDDIDDYKVGVDVLNRDGIARRLYLAYNQLTRSLPKPSEVYERTPLIHEWLAAAAKFSVRPDIRGTGPTSFLDREFNAKHRPPLDWKPTPWFPVPWSKTQLNDFDRMPTLGYIHRPVFVKMTDEHGKPLGRRDARQQALLAGLHEALQTLPEAERAKGPARVIAATNNQTEQLVALEGALHGYAADGGPEIDSGKLKQFINIDRRLGNTGASTLFMQMAIGVMGSYRDGGPSMAVNLRDPHEASIIFISPPPDEKRKTQEHARGGDVFRSIQSPAIDPANYAVPDHQ